MATDTAFQMAASNVRFGQGVTAEIGMDLRDMDVKRTLVVMDPALVDLPIGGVIRNSLQQNDIGFDIFSELSIEPTDSSFKRAAEVACEGNYDSYVAVGGGSTIDTCKAANLYATYPADFFAYVNAPIGEGKPVPGPTNPLIAIPTTAGTGSETTGVAIFDYVEKHAKTGIAHRYLKPTLGIVDSDNTRTMPAAVAASSGLDVLSHALESYTAIPFDRRPKPNRPLERPAYQGTNPISDIWAIRALELMAEFLPRAYADTTDDEARMNMLMASTIAGIGFGNAGVHLPHGMSYPVAGMVKSFEPPGYVVDHPIVPHGMSVILNTPAVVRFTAPTDPGRHLRAAAALGADVTGVPPEAAGDVLAERVIHFMKLTDMPNGLNAVGYEAEDIPALVQGTLPQHRVTKLSPLEAGEAELTKLFEDSMVIWEDN
ncbi:MAG: hydroxyacid-oxoacid transhydrogenase [Planctomycetota bacterium]|nr:hydroxyacid-oxoacid transhydrogenase [Planctomycetota bacterium]